MEFEILVLVLSAALLHGAWNLLLKRSIDRLVSLAILHTVPALLLLPPALFWLPTPHLESWPHIFASMVLHIGYNLFLIQAYAHGDLGQVYPIARGSAPLLTSVLAALVIQEPLRLEEQLGILLISLGIFSLIFRRGTASVLSRQGVLYALGTGAFIASYTVVDGTGVRLSGNEFSYIAWLCISESPPSLLLAWWGRRQELWPQMRQVGPQGALAGVMSSTAYGMVIVAMAHAPVSLVASVRETSVVLTPLLGVLLLKERFEPQRLLAAVLVLLGLLAMRFPVG